MLKIDKPIRLIELFAGVGSQAKALTRLGADFEHYKTSEWEVNATASYKAIHKENDNTDYSAEFTAEQLNEVLFNIGISTDGKKPMGLKEIARKNEQWKRTVYNNFKATNNIGSILNISGSELGIIDTDKYCYVLTYSFPCQDLSLAGQGKGMAKGSNTRSGLLWEVERLLNECAELPQILLMENVTQVHGTKNKEHFDEWIAFLESKGYSNYWKDLNSKNFGIPQNRNRTFMVSVLGGYTYEFPEEFPLELRLNDMLEESVDEKFYLSKNMIADISHKISDTDKILKIGTVNSSQDGVVVHPNGIAPTHTAGNGNTPKIIDPFYAVAMRGRYNENGEVEQNIELSDREYANAITTVQKDSLVAEPTVIDPFINITEKTVCEERKDEGLRFFKNGLRGTLRTIDACGDKRVIEPRVIGGIGEKKSNGGSQWYQQDRIYDNECAMSVTTAFNPYYKVKEPYSLRIRKLTPKECWRLMGFDDVDFEKAAAVNSNSQLYKQAGNSIVVDVLCYIFGKML